MPDLATRIDRAGRRAAPRRAPGGRGGAGRSRRWPPSPPSPSSAGGPTPAAPPSCAWPTASATTAGSGSRPTCAPALDHHLRPATERIRERATSATCSPPRRRREADNVHRTLDAVDRSAVRSGRRPPGRPPPRASGSLAGSAQDGIGRAARRRTSTCCAPASSRVAGSPVAVTTPLAHTEPGDVLVAIDLRRYERWVLDAATAAADATAASSIALTDSRLSPARPPRRGRPSWSPPRAPDPSTATWARWPSPTRSPPAWPPASAAPPPTASTASSRPGRPPHALTDD